MAATSNTVRELSFRPGFATTVFLIDLPLLLLGKSLSPFRLGSTPVFVIRVSG